MVPWETAKRVVWHSRIHKSSLTQLASQLLSYHSTDLNSKMFGSKVLERFSLAKAGSIWYRQVLAILSFVESRKTEGTNERYSLGGEQSGRLGFSQLLPDNLVCVSGADRSVAWRRQGVTCLFKLPDAAIASGSSFFPFRLNSELQSTGKIKPSELEPTCLAVWLCFFSSCSVCLLGVLALTVSWGSLGLELAVAVVSILVSPGKKNHSLHWHPLCSAKELAY